MKQKTILRERTAVKQISIQKSIKNTLTHEGKNGMSGETKPYLVKKEKEKGRKKNILP